MKKMYIYLLVLVLLCNFGINERWFEGVNLKVYDYGEAENSRFFMPNVIKIYGGCNKDVLIHELAHYDNQKLNHDSFFWLSYYRIKGGT